MGQTILITGSSSGIGRATAELFASRGWNVIATLRSPTTAGEWANHPRISLEQLDVTDHESIAGAITRVTERFGVIDALVNNAGYGMLGPFEASTPEQVSRQFATNVTGLMNVTRAILPHFRERRAGTLVNVSSVGGRVAFPLYSVYHATKWAVEGFSESLQFELRPFNIRVKLIEPGPIQTEFYDSIDLFSQPGLTAYDQMIRTAVKVMRRVGAGAPGPQAAASVIYGAVTDGTWKLRYPANGSALLWSRRLLPERLFRYIVRQALVR
jgi:NAD(P)-dependent dehydrogenase (short-subunit alcohol dehydrogenase family)